MVEIIVEKIYMFVREFSLVVEEVIVDMCLFENFVILEVILIIVVLEVMFL